MFCALLIPLFLLLGLAAFNALLGWLAIVSINGMGPPPRYTTRLLLVIMTITAVLLGLIGAAIHTSG
jgi:hypothetical protein